MSKAFRDAGNVQGYPELTTGQTYALRFYRNANGRQWKNKLREDWQGDAARNVTSDTSALLRQLRNTHGPVWLSKMQLKVVAWTAASVRAVTTSSCRSARAIWTACVTSTIASSL